MSEELGFVEGGERKESSGEARSRGQAKSFTLGEPPRTRLSWGMGAKERRLLGGSRGEGAKVLEAERGLVLVESRGRWGA